MGRRWRTLNGSCDGCGEMALGETGCAAVSDVRQPARLDARRTACVLRKNNGGALLMRRSVL